MTEMSTVKDSSRKLVGRDAEADMQVAVNLGNTAMASWSTDQVCEWLHSLGLGQYDEAFRYHEVNGGILSNLTEGQLKKPFEPKSSLYDGIGVKVVGHRIILLQNIKSFKKAVKIAKRNTILDEFKDFKICNCCRCWDRYYKISESFIQVINPSCCHQAIDNVDITSIEDISMNLYCIEGKILIKTTDPSIPHGEFYITLKRGKCEEVFKLLKSLWEQDQFRLATTRAGEGLPTQ